MGEWGMGETQVVREGAGTSRCVDSRSQTL